MKCIIMFFLVAAIVSFSAKAQVTHLVIGAVYGGGNNAGALFKNDFVEVFNPTASAVVATNWSVQYAGAAGTSWQKKVFSASIPAGRYYLVELAGGTTTGANLPTPDAIGTINMSATSGKVALVSDTIALVGATVSGGSLVDLLGYGTASGYETQAAKAASNTKCLVRINGGCTDTDDNFTDFVLDGNFVPLNSTSPANLCGNLPITLLYFTGGVVNNKPKLSWKTVSEINSSYFEIEKSTNNLSFITIGKINSKQVESGSLYSYLDEGTIVNKPSYRLKMVDNNGSFKYSNIVSLSMDAIDKLALFPNPVLNNLTVTHSKAAKGAMIKITTSEGKPILVQPVIPASTETDIDVSKLSKGIYIVVYLGNDTKVSLQFIK